MVYGLQELIYDPTNYRGLAKMSEDAMTKAMNTPKDQADGRPKDFRQGSPRDHFKALDARISDLGEQITSLDCERRRHALSIELLSSHLAKQRAVNEGLLSWANEMDYAPPRILAALREVLK